MRYLLVDISNSFTKLQLSSEHGLLGDRCMLPTSSLSPELLLTKISPDDFDHVIIASVVPSQNAMIETAFGSMLVTGPRIDLGYSLKGYPKPSTIGPDRLANAAGLVGKYTLPGIAVDCGTAITFDIVSENHVYLGGVIAPGLSSLTSYLHEKTALLPKIVPEVDPPPFGPSTESAMTAGCVNGFRGILRENLQQIQATNHLGEASVVVTGGDAEFAKKLLPELSCVDRDLTLEGLRIIGNMRFQN